MNNNIENNYQEENIDIKKYIFQIIGNWYLFVIFVFITFSIAYYVNKFTTPIYSVSSTLLVEAENSRSGAENLLEGLSLFSGKKNIENEIGILNSYSLTKKVIEDLDFDVSYFEIGGIKSEEIYQESPFVVKIDTAVKVIYGQTINLEFTSENTVIIEIDDVLLESEKLFSFHKEIQLGQLVQTDYFAFTVEKRKPEDFKFDDIKGEKFYFVLNDINSLTNKYRGKLEIEPINREASILKLTTEGEVAQKEVNFLNKLGSKYILSGLEDKNQIAKNTIYFIDDQLGSILDSLRLAEDDLQNFRLSNKIVNLGEEGSGYLARYEKLHAEKALLQIKSQYYDYLLEYIEQKDDYTDVIAPSTMGIEDALLNSTIQKLGELYQEKSAMLYSATENNPALNIINLNIQNTRANLLENIKNIIKTSKLSLNDINDRIAEVDSQIKSLPVTERQLLNIQRTFNLNNNIYTYLLEKRAEAGIAQASNIPDNKILDPAITENVDKVAPKSAMNYAIALVLGLIIPLLFLIGKDYFNDKIVDKKDIENNVRVPIFGTIGSNVKDSEIPVFDNPKSSISESFRSLRTNLQYLNIDNKEGSRVISVTSTVSGEGKTFCAINLAAIIAMMNKKVILLGLDLRKPKIHRAFEEIGNDLGISTFLIGKTKMEDVILATKVANLFVAPSGPVPPNPAELIESKNMENFINELKKTYDYIIIDTPPLALVTDALLVSKYTDTNIYVMRQNYSRKEVVDLINEFNERGSFKNLGIVINDIKMPSYYGYGGGYGYGYGYGYGTYGYGAYGYGHGYYDEDHKPLTTSEKIKKFFNLDRKSNMA